MDNNLNNGQQPVNATPEQPVNAQPAQPVQQTPIQPAQQTPIQPAQQTPIQPAQQTPIQPAQQTPVQPVNATPVQPQTFYQANPVKSTPGNMLSLLALALSAAGLLFAVVGTLWSCSASAKNSIKKLDFQGSWIFLIAFFGFLLAVAGIVLVVIPLLQKKQLDIMQKISVAVATVAIVMALLPNITICAYNSALNNLDDDKVQKKASEKLEKSKPSDDLSDYLDDYLD